MATPRVRRVMKEIQECQKKDNSSVTISYFEEGKIDHLLGTFKGPDNTPYAGGTFEVDIQIPEQYPFAPLKMRFITKVFHPNVSSQTGAICLDILKDSWSPILTLKTSLISLQSLLCSPEPNDPQDGEVAKIYLNDKKAFEDTAKYWTSVYAKGPEGADNADATQLAGLDPAVVETFTAMGFEKGRVIEVMRKLNFRGNNIVKVGEGAVVEELLS